MKTTTIEKNYERKKTNECEQQKMKKKKNLCLIKFSL